ncbi:acyltransferase family protein [Streptosporangium sandarakinum]|uniref:acyltransferase family protein n=1 Tax=Streptosporangium sandarakinum TaxID=1260955 RepID=UPI0033B1E0DE
MADRTVPARRPAPASGALTAFAARIEAATPAGRDRGADALRALAIAGVVGGHWLVTAWTPQPGGAVRVSSPLAYMPWLAPASWVLQTLAVFFFVGGYAAARSLRSAAGYRMWARARMRRLLRPVGLPALVWAGAAAGLALGGMPAGSIRSLVQPTAGPLWFLAVFTALTAATPLLRAAPLATAGSAAAVVLATDAVRFGLGGPSWAGWANVVAGWLVPYALGVAWAGGALASRRVAAGMLAAGAAGTAALVAWAGYPASMVGVTGAKVSNLSPPTLAVVCFGVAQVGLVLLVREPLARLMRRPRLWAAVALVNLSAMTVFLWHQTVLAAAALVALRLGGLPGLVEAPTGPAWLAHRLAWLPVLAALLALVVLAVRSAGRLRGGRTAGEDGRTAEEAERTAEEADTRDRRPGEDGGEADTRGGRPVEDGRAPGGSAAGVPGPGEPVDGRSLRV